MTSRDSFTDGQIFGWQIGRDPEWKEGEDIFMCNLWFDGGETEEKRARNLRSQVLDQAAIYNEDKSAAHREEQGNGECERIKKEVEEKEVLGDLTDNL